MAAKTNNEQQRNSFTGSLFDAFRPDDMISNAQKVLSSAVSVLEEEIAAGIVAAKRIEKKVIDTAAPASTQSDPDELMHRIRRDVHDAIDIFMDGFTAVSKQLGVLSATITKETDNVKAAATATKAKTSDAGAVPLIEPATPVKRGTKATLSFTIADATATAPIKIKLQQTDFTGEVTQKIAGRNIILTPAAFTLAPAKEQIISITINIPKNATPGHYSALLTGAPHKTIRAVISIEVI
jgi:hypothetical protein